MQGRVGGDCESDLAYADVRGAVGRLVAFEIDGAEPAEVVGRLLEKGIVASTSPYAITYARLAPSLVNTPEQVDAAVAAVRGIAGEPKGQRAKRTKAGTCPAFV